MGNASSELNERQLTTSNPQTARQFMIWWWLLHSKSSLNPTTNNTINTQQQRQERHQEQIRPRSISNGSFFTPIIDHRQSPTPVASSSNPIDTKSIKSTKTAKLFNPSIPTHGLTRKVTTSTSTNINSKGMIIIKHVQQHANVHIKQ